MQKVLLAFLDPDLFTDGIEIGAELACQLKIPFADIAVHNDHGFLEYIAGVVSAPLVLDHKIFDQGKIGPVNKLKDPGIMPPDPLDDLFC
jgi:hypothetical protein